MRTTFNAANSLSVFFLMTLIPQCLGRPASALFGRGDKTLPLSERRDSAIAERRESIIDRRESVISRRESVLPQDIIEDIENNDDLMMDVPSIMESKHQRLWINRDLADSSLEQSEAIDRIIRDMGYEAANIEARQLSSSYAPYTTSDQLAASTTLTSSVSTADASTSAVATSSAATSSLNAAITSSTTSAPASSMQAVSTSSSLAVSQSTAPLSTPSSMSTSISSSSSVTSAGAAALLSSSQTSLTTISSVYPNGAANKTAIIIPTISSTKILGTASHAPVMTFVGGQKPAPLPTLAVGPSVAVVDPSMQTGYPMWNGSGSLIINSGNVNKLTSLVTTPSFSRDQGKGGNVNGVNIFVFADTGSYTAPSANQGGNFTGFVSNSLAVDRGAGPAAGKPVTLSDPIGSYSNSKGAPRGFYPLTSGEQAYNNLMIPYGQRFAIWPESSIIPLNPTTGLMYAPIVYANTTAGSSSFTYSGTTLVEISVPSVGGPVANRVSPLLFPRGGVEWGCVGGIRSYGPNGINGGKVYVLGNHKTGLFIGRTNATTVTDPQSYEFFQGNGIWNSTVPSTTSNNIFVGGAYSTVDIFYSPRHLTFLMVYQDIYCDNTLYWRYLQAPQPILPKYAGGTWDDMVVAVTMYSWSKPFILLNLPVPGSGYTYGGGAHLGYFGANDISRGGNQMLLSWTAPTGQGSASLATSYATMTGMVTWA